MKKYFFISFLFFSFSLSAQKDLEPISLFFKTDHISLIPESESTLRTTVEKISTSANLTVMIKTFVADGGDNENNQKMAIKRARMLEWYLLSKEVFISNISIVSVAEITNDTSNSRRNAVRSNNRRVDIIFKPMYFDNINDLQDYLRFGSVNTKQTILTTDGTELISKNGIKIKVPSNAFANPDGSAYNEGVMIKLTEAFTPSDWILNNLTTTTKNGQILSSSGMLKVEAFAGGTTPLMLREGKKIATSIPNKGIPNAEMQFYEVTTSLYDDPNKLIIWENTPMLKLDTARTSLWNERQLRTIRRYQQELFKHLVDTTPYPLFQWKATLHDTICMAKANRKITVSAKPTPIRPFNQTPPKEPVMGEPVYEQRMKDYRSQLRLFEGAVADHRFDAIRYQVETAIWEKRFVANWDSFDKKMQDYSLAFITRGFNKRLFGLSNTMENGFPINKSLSPINDIIKGIFTEIQPLPIPSEPALYFDMIKKVVAQTYPNTAYLDEIILVYTEFWDLEVKQNQNRDTENLSPKPKAAAPTFDSLNRVYQQQINRLNWISCSVPLRYDTKNTRPLIVEETGEALMYLVLRKEKSILPFVPSLGEKKTYRIEKVPNGFQYQLLSIKVKDGLPQIFIKDMTQLPEKPIIPQYRQVSVKELKRILTKL